MDSETGSYELFLGQNFCTLISGNKKLVLREHWLSENKYIRVYLRLILKDKDWFNGPHEPVSTQPVSRSIDKTIRIANK